LSALTDFLRKHTDTDSPEDRPGFTGPPKSAKLAAELRDKPALGGLEILGSIGSSMAGQAVGGLRGLATLATGGGLDKAVDDIKGTEEALTYEPKSEGGKAGLAAIGKVIEPVNEYVRAHVADPIGEVSPAAGAAVLASSAILPGPKGLKGAAGGVRKAAKAGRAAGEAEVAGGAAERAVGRSAGSEPLAGSTADLQQQRAEALRAGDAGEFGPSSGVALKARLRAVGDAQRAYAADGSPANGTALAEAQAALRGHRERRTAQHTHTTGEPIMAEATGDWTPEPEPLFPPPNSWTPAEQQRGSSIGLAALDRWLAANDRGQHIPDNVRNELYSRAQDVAIRSMREGAAMGEAAAAADRALSQMHTPTGLQMDWGTLPDERQPLRLAGVDYSHLDAARSALRADALRNQKSLLPNVDPGWEHQTLIPGLSPLSPREGALMAARRLGIKTRELRRGDPSMNRAAVEAFFEGGRDNPEMFQYGVDPVRTGELSKHASLEDFADVYNSRTNADINIHREGGEPDYDSIDVDVEPEVMYHGRGEAYRDSSGEYVMKKKKHEAGDVPVYDERGNVKKEVIGFNEDEGPKKQKYVAEGGEIMREGGRYGGSPKLRFAKTTRSNRTPKKNDRGEIKYDSDYDPDAYQQRYEDAMDEARSNAESSDEVARMRAQGGGAIDVNYPEGGDVSVYAGNNKGKFGSLLYQTLLNHAAHSGYEIGGGGLTDINALRILSNANSNYARTGKNPRGLSGTNSGDLPPYRQGAYRAHEEYAKGPEIWRSESDEALKRAQGRGGAPERMAFDPELGFTLDGAPASPDQLKAAFESMSPGVKHTGVGMKTLMRSAVFDWVRDATPEQAAQVAKAWGKKHGPLFGVAGAGLTVQQALREKADEGTQ